MPKSTELAVERERPDQSDSTPISNGTSSFSGAQRSWIPSDPCSSRCCSAMDPRTILGGWVRGEARLETFLTIGRRLYRATFDRLSIHPYNHTIAPINPITPNHGASA